MFEFFIVFKNFYVRIYLVYVVLISGIQYNDSVMHTYIFIFSDSFFPNIEYRSLCYLAGLCWLCIFKFCM